MNILNSENRSSCFEILEFVKRYLEDFSCKRVGINRFFFQNSCVIFQNEMFGSAVEYSLEQFMLKCPSIFFRKYVICTSNGRYGSLEATELNLILIKGTLDLIDQKIKNVPFKINLVVRAIPNVKSKIHNPGKSYGIINVNKEIRSGTGVVNTDRLVKNNIPTVSGRSYKSSFMIQSKVFQIFDLIHK